MNFLFRSLAAIALVVLIGIGLDMFVSEQGAIWWLGMMFAGVALVQSFLLGLGFFAIGLQAAGPLTLVALLLGIIQIPLILLTLPVVAYVFFTEPTQPAVIFLIWNVVAGLSDNVLRPLLLGRGLEVPMPIILFGVIGA